MRTVHTDYLQCCSGAASTLQERHQHNNQRLKGWTRARDGRASATSSTSSRRCNYSRWDAAMSIRVCVCAVQSVITGRRGTNHNAKSWCRCCASARSASRAQCKKKKVLALLIRLVPCRPCRYSSHVTQLVHQPQRPRAFAAAVCRAHPVAHRRGVEDGAHAALTAQRQLGRADGGEDGWGGEVEAVRWLC